MMDWIRRKPGLAAAAAVVSLAALIVGILLLLAPPPAVTPARSVPAQAVQPRQSPATAERPPAAAILPVPAERPDWRRSSTRLDAAAATLSDALRAAGAGDAAAQYHVARTVRFCLHEDLAGPGSAQAVQRACGSILSNPGLAELAQGPAADAWVPLLKDAIRAGEPRALAYAALYCVDGSPCDPMSGQDRGMSLASAQSRAGRAIASGDPEAIFHAGLAIANDSIGRNGVRGAAWMLVACARGYDCSPANELNELLACPAGRAGCVPGANVNDRLESSLGSAGYAEAFALSQEYGQLLESGEPPVRSWSFGR